MKYTAQKFVFLDVVEFLLGFRTKELSREDAYREKQHREQREAAALKAASERDRQAAKAAQAAKEARELYEREMKSREAAAAAAAIAAAQAAVDRERQLHHHHHGNQTTLARGKADHQHRQAQQEAVDKHFQMSIDYHKKVQHFSPITTFFF